MGHYEDSFEYNEAEEEKAVKKTLKKELKDKLKKLNLDELHFVDTILSDLDSYRAFFRIIKDGVDTSGNKD
jgi:demethoxyubiquinone hydroxylase (CLK1/Coq7/Cat5 family)